MKALDDLYRQAPLSRAARRQIAEYAIWSAERTEYLLGLLPSVARRYDQQAEEGLRYRRAAAQLLNGEISLLGALKQHPYRDFPYGERLEPGYIAYTAAIYAMSPDGYAPSNHAGPHACLRIVSGVALVAAMAGETLDRDVPFINQNDILIDVFPTAVQAAIRAACAAEEELHRQRLEQTA